MYLRVVWNGRIGTAEEFSVGASFTIDNDVENWDQPSAIAIVAAIQAIPTPAALLDCFPISVALTGVRLEGHADTGATIGAAEAGYAPERTGTGIGAPHPPQTALVLSMKSSTTGQSGRGRLYWPAMSVELNSAFQVSDPSNTALVTAFASYLSDVSDAIQANAGLFPWTTVSLAVASPTLGTQAPVSRLEVGNILDTQRRRRNNLVEQRATVAYPPA